MRRLVWLIGICVLAFAGCEPNETSRWQTSVNKDPITDATNVYIVRVSDDDNAVLTLRCKDNLSEVIVTQHDIPEENGISTTYRFDSQPPVSAKWDSLHAGGGIGLPDTVIPAVEFARKMMEARKLTIRIEPERADTLTTTFTLDGLTDVLKPQKTHCDWKKLF